MDTDFSTEKPRITKLSGPNYRPWALQVKRWLQSLELWEVVVKGPIDPEATGMPETGTEEVPVASGSTETPEGASTGHSGHSGKARKPTKAELQARSPLKDAKAATLVMGVCTQTVLQHVLLLETAKEQWETLKRLYAPAGALQLSTKVQAFTGYQATKGTTIAEIATALTTLQAEIGDIDPKERPTESLKIGLFFQAVRRLNPLFGPLILQLELSGANRHWETVVAHVTEFERQIGPKKPEQTALKAETIEDKRPKRRPKSEVECYNCGKKGHYKRDCRSKPKGDSTGPKDPKQGTEKSASTGPLPTPGGSQGIAVSATTESCWAATEQGASTLN
jgi:hypothetical protein